MPCRHRYFPSIPACALCGLLPGDLATRVTKRVEWEPQVDHDPEALPAAFSWALGGLLDRCRDEELPAVGTLTVRRVDPGETLIPVSAWEFELDVPKVTVAWVRWVMSGLDAA